MNKLDLHQTINHSEINIIHWAFMDVTKVVSESSKKLEVLKDFHELENQNNMVSNIINNLN